jgi:hypothetical protein
VIDCRPPRVEPGCLELRAYLADRLRKLAVAFPVDRGRAGCRGDEASNIRSVVVLPAPFGPRKAVTEPGRMLAVRSSTATVAPNRLVSPRSSIVAVISASSSLFGHTRATALRAERAPWPVPGAPAWDENEASAGNEMCPTTLLLRRPKRASGAPKPRCSLSCERDAAADAFLPRGSSTHSYPRRGRPLRRATATPAASAAGTRGVASWTGPDRPMGQALGDRRRETMKR